jgi:4-amino-4-deoxy-L-arabinose transferase-like glycosyltransferase
MTRRAFAGWLTGITVGGLALRLVYVLGFHRNYVVVGDPFAYHYGANLLVHGHGFIVAYHYVYAHRVVQTAVHPPLYTLYLAIPSALGIGTVPVHMIWSALLGTGTIVVTAFVGRRVAGDRAGLIAAAIVALAPNIWVYDGEVYSETMAIFIGTLAVLLAYRALANPSLARVCALGLVCGLAALTRSELVLLIPALLLPVALVAKGSVSTRARVLRLAAGVLVACAVMSPWVGYNLSRFKRPVFLSSQLGATLAAANCRDTYEGPQLGSFTLACTGSVGPYTEESIADQTFRRRSVDFIEGHMSRVPVVMAARVGRVTGLFRPIQQRRLDIYLEGREPPLVTAGLVNTYLIELGALAGIIVFARQHPAPLFPLLVLPAIALFTVATMYGTNRFRASMETSLAILTAVAIDAAYVRLRGSRALTETSPAPPAHATLR